MAHPRLRPLTLAVALGLSFTAALPARADIFVVVNAASQVKAMTQKEAVDLYMGRSRAFPNGDYALTFDLPRDSPTRASFYRVLTGMNAAQINSYWSRLMFTGQVMPPQPMPTEKAVQDMIRRNPSGVGYLGEEPQDRSLRVVLVLKDSSEGQ